MTYPTYDQLVGGSTVKRLDDIRIDRTTSGIPYGRAFYTSARRRFTLKHSLTKSQAASLDSHYTSNRTTSFTFTWDLDNSSHTVVYESPPEYDTTDAPFVSATVVLLETG